MWAGIEALIAGLLLSVFVSSVSASQGTILSQPALP